MAPRPIVARAPSTVGQAQTTATSAGRLNAARSACKTARHHAATIAVAVSRRAEARASRAAHAAALLMEHEVGDIADSLRGIRRYDIYLL